MDWIEAIGYGRESLHAGAVKLLLRDDNPARVPVAESLVKQRVLAAGPVRVEARIGPARRRPIDLALLLTLESGELIELGIELKVDSAWSPRQLLDTAAEPNRGVLLALGCTALAATPAEMPSSWRLVQPQEWAEILSMGADAVRELDIYRHHIENEARFHEEAIVRVAEGMAVEDGRDKVALGHWAYFRAIVEASRGGVRWERKTLISGPLLTMWLDIGLAPHAGAYIELMALGDRRDLCVKRSTEGRDPGEAQRELANAVSVVPALSVARRPRLPRATAKSCTAVAMSLDGYLPRDVAGICDEVATLLGEANGLCAAASTGLKRTQTLREADDD